MTEFRSSEGGGDTDFHLEHFCFNIQAFFFLTSLLFESLNLYTECFWWMCLSPDGDLTACVSTPLLDQLFKSFRSNWMVSLKNHNVHQRHNVSAYRPLFTMCTSQYTQSGGYILLGISQVCVSSPSIHGVVAIHWVCSASFSHLTLTARDLWFVAGASCLEVSLCAPCQI